MERIEALKILELLGRTFTNSEELEDALLRLGVPANDARIPKLDASVRQWEVDLHGFKAVVEKKTIPKKGTIQVTVDGETVDQVVRDRKFGTEEVDHVTPKVERPKTWTDDKAAVS
jgi:hypothetical protein